MTYAQRAAVALARKAQGSEHLEPCEGYEEAIFIYARVREAFPLNQVVIRTPLTHGAWFVGVLKV
jgi:hypothetical protein